MKAMAQTESVCEHLHFPVSPAVIGYSEKCAEDTQRNGISKTVAGKSDYF